MIRLMDILTESTKVRLEPETILVLKKVVDLIFKKRKKFTYYTPITSVPITVADGTPGTVEISVDPELIYYGILETNPEDSTDPNDFIIKINPTKIKTKKGLYQTLYHEIMHATDPNFSTKYSEKYWSTYDPDIDEKYYGHNIEFRAFTNEFIEGLINEFKLKRKKLKNQNSINTLRDSLDNILNYFSKNEKLSDLSSLIIHDMYGGEEMNIRLRKTLEDIVVTYPEVATLVKKPNPQKLDYLKTLNLIKKFNPNEWNRFLGMLYKAVNEIKELI